jgi:2-oxoglutarate/2-oxoacid ferredoxin oxidoreductase subunit alpha
VLAPVSVGDVFGLTVEAFNIAEHYQTPVILLTDQEIAQRKETVDPIDTSRFELVERRRPTEVELVKYARFKLSESGISPISQPGLAGGNYLASGIEHNEFGRPTASGEMHAKMNEKRFRKFNPLKNRRDLFLIEGEPDAPIGVVSWGSVAGVAMEALRLAKAEGLHVKLLVPKLLYPVAEPVFQDFFASVKRGLFVEQSFQGQLYRLVRMYVDVPALVKSLAKSGSNPIQPTDVLEQLRAMVVAMQSNREQQPEPAED